eukprot:817071-Prymnesium_polylepis.1
MALTCCPDTLLKVRRRCTQPFESGEYDAEHFDYAKEHLKETSRGSRLPVQQPAKKEHDSLNEKFDSLIDV